jgi:hypothetical protein
LAGLPGFLPDLRLLTTAETVNKEVRAIAISGFSGTSCPRFGFLFGIDSGVCLAPTDNL